MTNNKGSRPSWTVLDIRHSRGKFGSKFMALNYLNIQKKRYRSEQEKINMRLQVLQKRLSNIDREVSELLNNLF